MNSFPCWFFDYDNDGHPDIFVCGYATGDGPANVAADYLGLPNGGQHPCLYHNNGDGTFTDVTSEAGLEHELLGMGVNFGDLDNDGFLDFYIGTGNPLYTTLVPNRMFRNDGGRRFQDVTTSGGFGNLQKGHAIAFADLRNNGQQDVYEEMGGAFTGDKFYTVLYANPGHANHWIGLKLEGVRSNRGAVGARIHISVKTKTGLRNIYRTVNSGGSFGSNPLRQDIGLGDALSIESIDIRWPAAGVPSQHLGSVPMDGFYKIREGSSAAEPWSLPRFEYRTTPAIADGKLPAKESTPLTAALPTPTATPLGAAQSSKSKLARPDELLDKGDVLAKSGDYQTAIARYTDAIAAASEQSAPDTTLARVYRRAPRRSWP